MSAPIIPTCILLVCVIEFKLEKLAINLFIENHIVLFQTAAEQLKQLRIFGRKNQKPEMLKWEHRKSKKIASIFILKR